MAFAELDLNPLLVKAATAAGYLQPTAVQQQAIPAALSGRDLLVSSQTGSGKTAAFLLPCLHRLAEKPGIGKQTRVLVLTPTRELAQQILRSAETYGQFLPGLRSIILAGGAPFGPQLRQLERRVDLIVATPGRLLDHLQRGRVDLSGLQTLVLDEADRMLDMGFTDDLDAILAKAPDARQTLLFSATLEGVVGRLAMRVTRDPLRIEVEAAPGMEVRIEQSLLFADDRSHKAKLLDSVLRDVSLSQAVVFTATKRSADEISGELRQQGHAVEALHGDMNQRERNWTLQQLRTGRVRVLVATDVAARGLDVPGITHVINFDLPRKAEDYVHRIGRTGRAGREGVAISFAAHQEKRLVRDIERYTAQTIRVGTIVGLEPKARSSMPSRPRSSAPAPRRSSGNGGTRSGWRA